VNDSPQVNENGVLEMMHITQCWVVLESLSKIIFHTLSVPVFSFHANEGRESSLTMLRGCKGHQFLNSAICQGRIL
jgi:hypothetical protein